MGRNFDGARRGWTGFSVLTLMLASGVGAGSFASWRGAERRRREREYSNVDKFVKPKYASVGDLESVSGFALKCSQCGG